MSTAGDALRKVQGGQPLRIPAVAYNAFVDAALDLRRRRMNQGAGAGSGRTRHPGAALVRNDTGGDLGEFAVVALSGVVITESDGHEQFAMGPVFKAVAPTAGCFVAVLQEPVRQDGIGQALVSGVTPVQVGITAGNTTWASATTATGKLTSAATGNCRLLWCAGTAGDQWAVVRLNVPDERVAVDAGNTPAFLAALFNDTGTKGEDDALVQLDALQGTAPDQRLRLYVPKANRPDDWDEKVAVDGNNTPNYLAALFNDTGSKSGNDVLVYRDDLQGAAPNQKVRLFFRASDFPGTPDQPGSGVGNGFGWTFIALSTSSSYDEMLDESIDWRCRHIEAWITEPVPTTGSAAPTTGAVFVGSAPASSVTLVTEGVYTVYVSTDGKLKVSGSAETGNYAVIWVRCSARLCTPCSCTVDAEAYELNLTVLTYASNDCSGAPTSRSDTIALTRAGDCYYEFSGMSDCGVIAVTLGLDCATMMKWILTIGFADAGFGTSRNTFLDGPVGPWPNSSCGVRAGGGSYKLIDVSISEAAP